MNLARPVMDRVSRRSAMASIVVHGILVLIALVPGITTAVRHNPEVPPATTTPPPQRLVLAPSARAPAPPLPALPAAALPGFADSGSAPVLAEVSVPRNTDRPGADRSRGDAGSVSAPVQLPRAAPDPLANAARLDGRRWSEQELNGEQKRIADTASFIEALLRGEYRGGWYRLKTQITKPTLYLRIQVDAHGRVVAGSRLSTTGSPPLDEAIDHWLRQEQGPISLPSIAPGVMHVFAVTLF